VGKLKSLRCLQSSRPFIEAIIQPLLILRIPYITNQAGYLIVNNHVA
jgi:hypothetical protein